MKQTVEVNVTNFLAKQTPKFNKQPCAVRHTTDKTVLQWRKFKQCFALNHAAKSIYQKLQKQRLGTLESLNRFGSLFIIEKQERRGAHIMYSVVPLFELTV